MQDRALIPAGSAFPDVFTGTQTNIQYNWDPIDYLSRLLNSNGIWPQWAFCYNPIPTQPSQGARWNEVPNNLTAFSTMAQVGDSRTFVQRNAGEKKMTKQDAVHLSWRIHCVICVVRDCWHCAAWGHARAALGPRAASSPRKTCCEFPTDSKSPCRPGLPIRVVSLLTVPVNHVSSLVTCCLLGATPPPKGSTSYRIPI